MTQSIDDVLKNVVLQFMFEPCDSVTNRSMHKLIGWDLGVYITEHLKVDLVDPMNIRVSCGDLFDKTISVSHTEELI